jgi:hypothetical protein
VRYSELPPLPESTGVIPPPLSNMVIPPAPQPSIDTLLAEVPEPPMAASDWFILPVVWGNRLFDRSTMLLGKSGGWLRGSAGRSALGLAGLLMLAAAILWVVRDLFGWTP